MTDNLSQPVTITYHKAIDKSFDISKELVHCILLWIKAEVLGYLLIRGNHSFVHAFKNFTLFLGNPSKLVHLN